MHLEASWRVVGIVTELRELISQKNEKWRGYVLKAATLGLTVEISVTHDQYKSVATGQHLEIVGTFENNAGHMRLVAQHLAPFTQKGGKP